MKSERYEQQVKAAVYLSKLPGYQMVVADRTIRKLKQKVPTHTSYRWQTLLRIDVANKTIEDNF